MWGGGLLTRVTTGFDGSRRSKEERDRARAQHPIHFAAPRVYCPEPFLRGIRRHQSPSGWETRRIRPPVRHWLPWRLRPGRGRSTWPRDEADLLRREQEQREYEIRQMQGNRGFEHGARLVRAPIPDRARHRTLSHHREQRAIHPARGHRARPEALGHPYAARRVRQTSYHRHRDQGRRGSMASSEESYDTQGSPYSESSSDEDSSDASSYTRERPPPRGGYPPPIVRPHGGRRGSIRSDYGGIDPYGRVSGLRYPHPYGGGYSHSNESFNVFPSTSRESW